MADRRRGEGERQMGVQVINHEELKALADAVATLQADYAGE
jgi:hypothetical protein